MTDLKNLQEHQNTFYWGSLLPWVQTLTPRLPKPRPSEKKTRPKNINLGLNLKGQR